MRHPRLVLGSSSQSRIEVLKSIGYLPDLIIHPEIDETPLPGELPRETATRLAMTKAGKINKLYPEDVVISADTVCATGRFQLPKALCEDDVRFCLKKLSGKRHKTYTSICGMRGERHIQKLGITTVKFKILSEDDIEEFIADKSNWYGKAGGYSLMSTARAFVLMINGDETSSVVGLPAYHARNIIKTLGENKIKKQ